MVELRAHEQQVLTALQKLGGKASVEQMIESCGFPDAAVMRSALVLSESGFAVIHAETKNVVKLTSEGEQYAKDGLPERRLICAVLASGGTADLAKAAPQAGLQERFAQIALGWVLRKKWATLNSKENTLHATDAFRLGAPEGCDEVLVHRLNEKQENLEDLSKELQSAADQLKKRKLVTIEPKTHRILQIVPEGEKAVKEAAFAPQEVTQLTPELIVTGKWHTTKLQKYSIEAPVAKTWSGKKHPYLSFLDEVRAKLVTLGFKEMTGTCVESSFFNFDALYVPQDHPARETSDIYYIRDPKYGDVSSHAEALEHVKETHENGWTTGSTGWGYKYSLLDAQRLILRGHGTCLSARQLLSKDLEIPSKYFSIARVYRPEVVDRTHLSEFNQVEGIIVDEKLTLKDLLGALGKFAMDIAGADKVRFKPDYFPFTEPSVELSAFKEGYGWIEFGGSGIFRPEVTLPLGVTMPVIAWGLGVDRLFMMRAGIDDIRSIFSQDLNWLRSKQVT